MKTLGTLLVVLSIVGTISFCFFGVRASYEWSKSYGSNWELGIKSSTIEKKSEYIDKFVSSLEKSGLQGENDALIFYTPNNNFDENFTALKSLQSRLHEIKGMDAKSFEYQTAIQQITGQEQDEAGNMLMVLEGCWWKVHHYVYWNVFILLGVMLSFVLMFVFGCLIVSE